jgi:hypothetical protein
MLCVYLFSDQFNLKEIVLNIDLGNSPLSSDRDRHQSEHSEDGFEGSRNAADADLPKIQIKEATK